MGDDAIPYWGKAGDLNSYLNLRYAFIKGKHIETNIHYMKSIVKQQIIRTRNALISLMNYRIKVNPLWLLTQ